MNGEKYKKIRRQLISLMNQELIRNKKSKKSKFLINSMTLEQLEKKNMQCKDFYIKEKDQIYQNIDNGWIIGLNIYINNSFNNNPYIQSLSNLIRDNYLFNDITNKRGMNINQIENINNNKETIIQKQSNKILYIQKEGNMGSPVDTSLLIKKELGERKLKIPNNDFNSNKIHVCHSDRIYIKENRENDNIKENERKDINNLNNNINDINDIEDNNKISKQLSNETLETELSRIIKICHDDKYTNSFEHFPSDSKISILSKEIKIAKMYAKKLKCYCRTLKRKFPLNNNDNNNKFENILKTNNSKNEYKIIFQGKNYKDDKQNNVKKEVNNIEEKIKKIKKFSSNKKIIEKIKEEYNPLDNNHKYVMPYKKIKSERNIKFKIKRNSFLKIIKEIDNTKCNNNNNISTCSNNNKYRTLEEKGNRKRTNILKVTKKKNNKKDMEEELLIKPKFKIKKELIKLSSKLIKNKFNRNNKKLSKNHKTMNDIFIITDSPKLSIINTHKKKKKRDTFLERRKKKLSTEADNDNNSKKIKKLRRKLEDFLKSKKSSNLLLIKNKNKKRVSVDTKINLSGFEKLNFLKMKTKSTQEHLLSKNKKKKIKVKLNNINNNNININTSISQQRNSSPSIERSKKHKKNNNKNKNIIHTRNYKDNKKKTFAFFKTKRTSTVIEALKKMKKRKSTNFNDENPFCIDRRLSPIYNEERNINNTISDTNKKNKNNSKKNKIKFSKNIKELNSSEINDNNKETDIFNIMDEFLYKKKHERRKNVIY